MIEREFPAAGRYVGTVICPTGSASAIVSRSWVSVRCDGGGTLAIYFQRSADSDDPAPGTGNPWTRPFKHAHRVYAELPSGTEYIQYDITTNGAGALLIEQLAK